MVLCLRLQNLKPGLKRKMVFFSHLFLTGLFLAFLVSHCILRQYPRPEMERWFEGWLHARGELPLSLYCLFVDGSPQPTESLELQRWWKLIFRATSCVHWNNTGWLHNGPIAPSVPHSRDWGAWIILFTLVTGPQTDQSNFPAQDLKACEVQSRGLFLDLHLGTLPYRGVSHEKGQVLTPTPDTPEVTMPPSGQRLNTGWLLLDPE